MGPSGGTIIAVAVAPAPPTCSRRADMSWAGRKRKDPRTGQVRTKHNEQRKAKRAGKQQALQVLRSSHSPCHCPARDVCSAHESCAQLLRHCRTTTTSQLPSPPPT